MAASVLLRNIGGIDDKRLVLANDQCGRVLAIGSNWNKLRIGVRWAIDRSGLTTGFLTRFAVGLCSGTSAMYGNASTTNFIGLRQGAVASQAACVYGAGPPPFYTHFDEAAGALNAINICYGQASRPLEVSDVIYARIE